MVDSRAPSFPETGANGAVPMDALRAGKKQTKRLVLNLLGMGAEILFVCGLILIGFLISLLSGR